MPRVLFNLIVTACAALATYWLGAPSPEPPPAPVGASEAGQPLVIDDFEDGDRISKVATNWLPYTDQPLGGSSSAHLEVVPDSGQGMALRIRGDVHTDYAFGFAGVALPLPRPPAPVGWRGLRFRVRGDGRFYSVKLATSDVSDYDYFARHFRAPAGGWNSVDVPFSSLRQLGYGRPARWDVSRLEGLQITTFGPPPENYRYELSIDDIALY